MGKAEKSNVLDVDDDVECLNAVYVELIFHCVSTKKTACPPKNSPTPLSRSVILVSQ